LVNYLVELGLLTVCISTSRSITSPFHTMQLFFATIADSALVTILGG